MRWLLLLLAAIIFSSEVGFTQDLPGLLSNHDKKLIILEDKSYDSLLCREFHGEGAALFHEFGGTGIRFQWVRLDKQSLKIEIYRMKNTISAWGFSSLRSVGGDSFVSSNLYINIIGDNNSDQVQNAIFECGRLFREIAEPSFPELPGVFSELGSDQYQFVKMVEGPIAMNTFFKEWTPYFNGLSNYIFYFTEYLHPETQTFVSFLETDELNLKRFYYNSGVEKIQEISTVDSGMGKMVLITDKKGLIIIIKDRE